jgi:hypothetical protein
VLGFALRSVENVILYAVNSDILGNPLASARAGELRQLRIDCSLPLPGGPVFTDFTVASLAGGELKILDARMSMLRLEMRSSRALMGLVDLGARLSVL